MSKPSKKEPRKPLTPQEIFEIAQQRAVVRRKALAKRIIPIIENKDVNDVIHVLSTIIANMVK